MMKARKLHVNDNKDLRIPYWTCGETVNTLRLLKRHIKMIHHRSLLWNRGPSGSRIFLGPNAQIVFLINCYLICLPWISKRIMVYNFALFHLILCNDIPILPCHVTKNVIWHATYHVICYSIQFKCYVLSSHLMSCHVSPYVISYNVTDNFTCLV